MTSRASFSDDSRMFKKSKPISLLLRDYLLDDMSSCSSNGFRSYPRRQCCITNKNGKPPPPLEQQRRSILESKTKWKSKSKPKPKQLSVLQRASAVMINVFNRFTFSGNGNPAKAKFLPRSLSRKLLKHGFWKKTDHHNKEIKKLKSFGDFINEEETTPPRSPSKFSTAVTTTTAFTEPNTSSISNTSSWSDSEFTATTDRSTSTTVNSAQNVVVADYLPENKKTTNGKGVGATTTTATTTTNYSPTTENAKKWQNEQDEQFSPVSVMDFPCDNDNDVDEEDEGSFVLQDRYIEGTKKLVHKTRRFKSVSQLEPVKLEDRLAQLGLDLESSTQSREEDQQEKKAMALLQLMKSTNSSHDMFRYEVVENLLLGFFKERMIEQSLYDYEMLKMAKDWMDGEVREIVLDWESKRSRETYIREMEKGVKWLKYDDEVEKENVILELEYEIFTSLVHEIQLDFQIYPTFLCSVDGCFHPLDGTH